MVASVDNNTATSDVAAARLPTQNELFAFFMLLCGHHRIKKPPVAIAALLEEDDTSRSIRLHREAVALHVHETQLVGLESEETTDAKKRRQGIVALSSRTAVSLASSPSSSDGGSLAASKDGRTTSVHHIGNRGVVVWLRLLAECPLLEVFDLSCVTSLYAADAYRTAISGNSVVDVLCEILEVHPSVRSVNLLGHPLGTVAGRRVLQAVQRNRRIQEVQFESEGIDRLVVRELTNQLQANVACAKTLPPPKLSTVLSHELVSVQWVDRKTSRERQALRNLLFDLDAFKSCSTDALDEMVDHASRVSLETVVKDSAGLRGDREHLTVIESGALDVWISNTPFQLGRGAYFGYAYESAMYSAGLIAEKERGYAFQIPLSKCTEVLAQWEAAVALYYPTVKACVPLQGAHVWMLLRACHTAETVVVPPGTILTPRSKPFRGLFIVAQGRCVVQDVVGSGANSANPAALLLTKRMDALTADATAMSSRSLTLLDRYKASEATAATVKELQRLDRGSMPATPSTSVVTTGGGAASMAQPRTEFAVGDMFGEEPLTLRRITTFATEIVAAPSGPGAAEEAASVACVQLLPEGAAPIVACMKLTLRVLTKQYTHAFE